MNTKWSIYAGETYVDSGTHREDERATLDAILSGTLGNCPRDPSTSYRVSAGNLSASAYGDEFHQVGQSTAIDETDLDVVKNVGRNGGYLFPSDAYVTPEQAKRYMKGGTLDELAQEVGKGMARGMIQGIVERLTKDFGKAVTLPDGSEDTYVLDDEGGIKGGKALAPGDKITCGDNEWEVTHSHIDADGNWSGKIRATGADPKLWSNVGSDPLGDIRRAKEEIEKQAGFPYIPPRHVVDDPDRERERRALDQMAKIAESEGWNIDPDKHLGRLRCPHRSIQMTPLPHGNRRYHCPDCGRAYDIHSSAIYTNSDDLILRSVRRALDGPGL